MFFISVSGGRAAHILHQTEALAIKEARRLSAMPENRTTTIRVFELKATLLPQTSHLLIREQDRVKA